jgi:hypothetical protein
MEAFEMLEDGSRKQPTGSGITAKMQDIWPMLSDNHPTDNTTPLSPEWACFVVESSGFCTMSSGHSVTGPPACTCISAAESV